MITYLKLANYRRHTNLELNFTKGLNVIRASVEAGKTTVLEAIAYAMFGSAALPQKLDEVVTYGVPLSKLRVDMHFSYLGVDYQLYRGKSGCELNFAGQKITGQSEVTKYMEQLLGANAKLAGMLMIAEQAALRGALNEGPTGAGKIIEALADFDLLDRLIEMVPNRLPYGNTDGVQGRIKLLMEQTVAEEVDLSGFEAAVTAGAATVDAADSKLQVEKAALNNLDVDLANQILRDEQRLNSAIAKRTGQLEQLAKSLATEPVDAPDPADIEALRVAVAAEKNMASALAIKADLVRLPESNQWDQDLASLQAELEVVDRDRAALEAKKEASSTSVQDANVERIKAENTYRATLQKLESQLIKEETCALCGKDLKDVPEVAAVNNPLFKEIERLKAAQPDIEAAFAEKVVKWEKDLEFARTEHGKRVEYLRDLRAVLADHNKVEAALARAGDNVTVDKAVVPWRWTWVGPDAAGASKAPALKLMEQQAADAVADVARRAEWVQQRNVLSAEQVTDTDALGELQITDAKETLELATAAKGRVDVAQAKLIFEQLELQDHKVALAGAKAQADAAAKAAEQAKVQLELAQKELAEIEANNVLVKKLRAARPAITDKLWNMVLAAVSKYFSQMRGEASKVYRADGQFKVNHEPVAGVSGSTKDILGLAIRAALVRTFLPMTPFMVLDEPAAACDDGRENAMLGLISTLGFEQTIMVTHSDLADASADNLITL